MSKAVLRTEAREALRAAEDILHPAFFKFKVVSGSKHPALVIETPEGVHVKRIPFSGSPRTDNTYNWTRLKLERWLRERDESGEI